MIWPQAPALELFQRYEQQAGTRGGVPYSTLQRLLVQLDKTVEPAAVRAALAQTHTYDVNGTGLVRKRMLHEASTKHSQSQTRMQAWMRAGAE